MIIASKDDKLKGEYVAKALPDDCAWCGKPMYHNYNEEGELTKRFCSAYFCRAKIAYQLSDMCKNLGITGVGFASALRQVDMRQLPFPVLYLPALGFKGKINFEEFIRFLYVEGLSKAKIHSLYGYCSSMEEVIKIPSDFRETLKVYAEILEKYKHVEIPVQQLEKPKYDTEITLNVAVTGDISLVKDRTKLPTWILTNTLGVVSACLQSTVNSKTDFLLCDVPSSTFKYNNAKSLNVPIVSSKEFIDHLILVAVEAVLKSKGEEYAKNYIQEFNLNQ